MRYSSLHSTQPQVGILQLSFRSVLKQPTTALSSQHPCPSLKFPSLPSQLFIPVPQFTSTFPSSYACGVQHVSVELHLKTSISSDEKKYSCNHTLSPDCIIWKKLPLHISSKIFFHKRLCGMLFPCCNIKKGIPGKRFKSHCLQSSLAVCFQYTPVLLHCSAILGIFKFLQLHQYEMLDSCILAFMYIYLHTEKAHQLGNLITVSFVKMCFCCMWEYYAHRKSTGAVSLSFLNTIIRRLFLIKKAKSLVGRKFLFLHFDL